MGSTPSTYIFLVAAVVAALGLFVARGKDYRKAAAWAALALLGQAASLQLIDAGNQIHYQHYRLGGELFQAPAVFFFGVIGVQAAATLWRLTRSWRQVWAGLRSFLQTWQILALIFLLFLPSAALSREPGFYLAELLFAGLLQLVNLGTIAISVASLSETSHARLRGRVLSFLDLDLTLSRRLKGRIDRFALLSASGVFLVTTFLSGVIYQRHPHVQDEVLYLYQARTFSQGMLTTPAPEAPEGFFIYMIPYRSEAWYSPFPPGWPALLSVGVMLQVPWLVNPFLSAINVLLAYSIFAALFPRRYARLATLGLAVSPWFLFMGMNLMSHTFMLTCGLAAGLAVLSAIKQTRWILGLVAGAFIGMLSLIRPMDSLVIGSLLSVGVFFALPYRQRWKILSGIGLGALALGSLVLPYNRAITGHPLEMPLNSYYEQYYGLNTYALGFGPDRGINWAIDPLPGYSPLEALMNAALNLFSVNVELFGWATGSLFLIGLAIFWGYRFFTRTDGFFLALVLVTVGSYALFWFSGGPDFGARYWYLLIFPLVYFSARGLQWMDEKGLGQGVRSRLLLAVILLVGLSLVNYLPWRAVDKYFHYLGMRPDIRTLIDEGNFGKSLILVQGQAHPDYESAWTYNPLDYQADAPLFAYDRNAEVRSAILEAYSDRPVWILQGPTLTGSAYQILAGPLPANQVEGLLK
ncbi:MAG: glycosyltransferase family 39 protein [Anaerolineales bacterium]|jgi:hypothetical protein|nr:glycosyltransferase family 39 protein [Anaerolineales bacterium]